MRIDKDYRRSLAASNAVVKDELRGARAVMFGAWVVIILALVAIGAHWE